MTKERKNFIMSIYRSYEENKKLVKFLNTKVGSSLSEGETEYYGVLKKKVEVVEKMLLYAELEGLEKKKFVEEYLIKGYSRNRVSVDCFSTSRTLLNWEQRFMALTDNCLSLYGI